MDGKHFPMKVFEPGVTAPPFHVWCRSCTCPYFNDEWSGGERAAKDEDGKTYYVQAHELSHRMDIKEYNSFNNNSFINAIEKSKVILDNNRNEITSWFELDGKYVSSSAMSDIVSALSHNSISVSIGHENKYWDAQQENVPMEIFANISAMDVLNSSELNDFKTMFSELFNAYKEIVK